MNEKDNPTLPTYYTILPACIRLNPNIIPGAKLLWSDISVLSLKLGYCYSTNDFFARIYGVSIRTINVWIKNLKQLELITIKHFKTDDGNKVIRHIMPNTSHPNLTVFFAKEGKKMLATYEKNAQLSYAKNCTDNITRKNNTRLNKGIPLTELTSVDTVSEAELDNCFFQEDALWIMR